MSSFWRWCLAEATSKIVMGLARNPLIRTGFGPLVDKFPASIVSGCGQLVQGAPDEAISVDPDLDRRRDQAEERRQLVAEKDKRHHADHDRQDEDEPVLDEALADIERARGDTAARSVPGH